MKSYQEGGLCCACFIDEETKELAQAMELGPSGGSARAGLLPGQCA